MSERAWQVSGLALNVGTWHWFTANSPPPLRTQPHTTAEETQAGKVLSDCDMAGRIRTQTSAISLSLSTTTPTSEWCELGLGNLLQNGLTGEGQKQQEGCLPVKP